MDKKNIQMVGGFFGKPANLLDNYSALGIRNDFDGE